VSSGLRYVTHSATHVYRASGSRGMHSPLWHSIARSERDLQPPPHSRTDETRKSSHRAKLHCVHRNRQVKPRVPPRYRQGGDRAISVQCVGSASASGESQVISMGAELGRRPQADCSSTLQSRSSSVGLYFGSILDGRWLWGVIEWSKAHHYE
jgi:hypothetical protein